MKNSWPKIRAALIALHILAVILVAFPAPSPAGVSRSLDDPSLGVHLGPWARLFHADQKEFARRIFSIGATWLRVRARVIGPFVTYLDNSGAIQNWHMFSAPSRVPFSFVLEARRLDGEWQFVSGVPAGDWHRSFFTSERTRSFVNVMSKYEADGLGDPFCEYLARELLAESDFAEARCQLIRTSAPKIRAPHAPRESQVSYEKVVRR